jgi:hypothetical protein
MANVVTIAKANATAIAMERVTGVYPELDIQSNYVRLYYPADTLPAAQAKFEKILNDKTPSDVRIDYSPLVTPVLIKKYWFYPVGALLAAFLIGRLTKK